MAVKFAPKSWQKWLEGYVREATSVRLIGADGKPIPDTERPLVAANWRFETRDTSVLAIYPELMWRFRELVAVAGVEVLADGEWHWSEEFTPVTAQGLERQKVQIQALELVLEMEL